LGCQRSEGPRTVVLSINRRTAGPMS